MSDFKLFLSAATIAVANATKKGLLSIPTADENDTLYVRGENDKKWREHFVVKDTGIEPWAEKPEVAKITCQFQVTEEAYEKNAKRVMTKTYWVNTQALADPTHKDYKRTMMAIGSLNALIRAAGIELEKDDSGRVAYHEYFAGDDKKVVGKQFWGVVRDYTYKNRDGELVNDQEISSFLPNDK